MPGAVCLGAQGGLWEPHEGLAWGALLSLCRFLTQVLSSVGFSVWVMKKTLLGRSRVSLGGSGRWVLVWTVWLQPRLKT